MRYASSFESEVDLLKEFVARSFLAGTHCVIGVGEKEDRKNPKQRSHQL